MKTNWSIWKTLDPGRYRDADAIKAEIKNAGMKIGNWGENILSKLVFTPKTFKGNRLLTRITVAELGFETMATYKDICAKAIGEMTVIDGVVYKVELCPSYVGPLLRIQYADQPKNERLRIAMEPINDSKGDSRIFSVVQDEDDLWLRGDTGYENNSFYNSHVFVFVLEEG